MIQITCDSLYLFLISSCNDNDELPLYSSFEETVAECVLCGSSEDIPMELGKKITVDDVTVHHFCLVSEMKMTLDWTICYSVHHLSK